MEINELNKIYKKTLDITEMVGKDLSNSKIRHKMGFYNNHEIKQKYCFVKELYPIPVISCKISDINIDIGFDIITTPNYMGFLELTLSKNKILNLDFDMLKNINFDIYGFKNFKEDYYFGDIKKAKQMIMSSKESKFHIGIEFSNINELKELLGLFKKLK